MVGSRRRRLGGRSADAAADCAGHGRVTVTALRNGAVAALAVVAVVALGLADLPGWDNVRLVGLVAMATVATDLLSRGHARP